MPKKKKNKVVASFSLDPYVVQGLKKAKDLHFFPSDSAVVNMILNKALRKMGIKDDGVVQG